MAETLQAEPRKSLGKRNTKRLRAGGKVPAVIYGGKEPPVLVALELKDLARRIQSSTRQVIVLSQNLIDAERLAAEQLWPLSVINTIDAYRDAPIRYFIPRVEELHALLAERLRRIASHTPGYEDGGRFRIVALERSA
jgi:large subunit ribosomal protein L25